MSFQVDGNLSLAEQERQLQALENFFVEVIDYQAGANVRNDVTTKDVLAPVPAPLRLSIVADAGALAAIVSTARAIVFDRVDFVLGQRQRVVGFRR